MSPELSQLARELLGELPWSVVLPAGCGKTELIAAIAANVGANDKPILVLTHTNAGVDVVRKRFAKYSVTSKQARVSTLDSWAMHFADHFPLLGNAATLPQEADSWLIAKLKAKEIFKSTHIGDIINATYSAILVDEYQDCSDLQHEIIVAMSQYIPIGVLGDPLQGIFDFGEGVVSWETVETAFPPKTLTPTPHRWATRNPALGQWLLDIRPQLIPGATIDFAAAGVPITWQISDSREEGRYCVNAANAIATEKQIVALRQQPAQCHKFARRLFNKFSVAEELELTVAKKLMTAIDEQDGAKVAAAILEFVRNCCVGCAPALNEALVNEYARGNPKTYTQRNTHAAAFEALNTVLSDPRVPNIQNAFQVLKGYVTRIFRHEAWACVIHVLHDLAYTEKGATIRLQEVRNKKRYGVQTIIRHKVSRTLLEKGQEYDECIILGADGMSARHLYVALSRGIDKVTIFSNTSTLRIVNY